MRLGLVLGGLAHFFSAGNSQSAPQTVAEALAVLPECTQKCTIPVVTGLNCNISTLASLAACLCPNIPAQHELAACVQKNCTFPDQKFSTKENQLLCGNIPIENRQWYTIVVLIVVTALTIPFIMLRGWSRWIIAKHFASDDWAILVAAVLIVLSMCLEIKMTLGGFGRHIWTVDLDNLFQILVLYYSVSILYAAIQGATKVSICLFYLRVFPQRWFRIATKLTIAYITASCSSFIFAIAFQCAPAASFWDRSIPGKCINQSIMIYCGAGASISQHVIILLLPIPCIKSLQLGRGKELSLFVMFGLGTFALVTSLVRVKYAIGFGSTTDVTWDNSNIEVWSVIELAVAFICACLPALRPLLVKYLPALFSGVKSRYGCGQSNEQQYDTPKSNGGITVSSAFQISRSRVRSGHMELEDNESGQDGEYIIQRPDDIHDLERPKAGHAAGLNTWSSHEDDTEMVHMGSRKDMR